MSLISFPDVPQLPGVPSLPSNGSIFPSFGIPSYTQQLQDSSTVTNIPLWQITDANGMPILLPDSIVEFEYRGEQKIPNYPVEQGSFSNYNKISMPFDARLTCTCSGNESMSKQGFLAAIDVLLRGLQLCAIVTPDATYQSVNLIHVDYRRDSRQGVSLILVQLWFQEVRQANLVVAPTADPSLSDPVNHGQVGTTSPTASQTAAINGAPIQ